MTTRVNELREQRTALAKAIRNMLDQNPGAKWAADPSLQTRYDDQMTSIENIDAELSRLQKAADLDADKRFDDAVQQVQKGTVDPLSVGAIHNAWLRGGESRWTAEQARVYRNTMSTTTGSEGGYGVQSAVAASVIEMLKAFGGMRAVSESFTTEQGNPLSYPTSDGTSETGELVAQNVSATDPSDPTFGTVAVDVYKFGSKVIVVPIELIQDATFDVEGFVNRRLVQRIGRAQNTYFTTGTGTSQPRGVVTGSSLGKTGTTGQTTTVIYDDLVDLQHSVDPAYRALGCHFMMADSSLKVIRKLKDTANRPIFIPSYDESIKNGAPATLLGDPIQINQDVAAMAANAKSILYGEFKSYKIRDVMQITMFRFTDSAYAKKGQVGFLAWARAGGNLTDTTAVKHYANSAT